MLQGQHSQAAGHGAQPFHRDAALADDQLLQARAVGKSHVLHRRGEPRGHVDVDVAPERVDGERAGGTHADCAAKAVQCGLAGGVEGVAGGTVLPGSGACQHQTEAGVAERNAGSSRADGARGIGRADQQIGRRLHDLARKAGNHGAEVATGQCAAGHQIEDAGRGRGMDDEVAAANAGEGCEFGLKQAALRPGQRGSEIAERRGPDARTLETQAHHVGSLPVAQTQIEGLHFGEAQLCHVLRGQRAGEGDAPATGHCRHRNVAAADAGERFERGLHLSRCGIRGQRRGGLAAKGQREHARALHQQLLCLGGGGAAHGFAQARRWCGQRRNRADHHRDRLAQCGAGKADGPLATGIADGDIAVEAGVARVGTVGGGQEGATQAGAADAEIDRSGGKGVAGKAESQRECALHAGREAIDGLHRAGGHRARAGGVALRRQGADDGI